MAPSRIFLSSTMTEPQEGGAKLWIWPAIKFATMRFCPVLSCNSLAIRRRSSSCARNKAPESFLVASPDWRSSSMAAPRRKTGIATPKRKICRARTLVPGSIALNTVDARRFCQIETTVTTRIAPLAPRSPNRIAAQSISGSGE